MSWALLKPSHSQTLAVVESWVSLQQTWDPYGFSHGLPWEIPSRHATPRKKTPGGPFVKPITEPRAEFDALAELVVRLPKLSNCT
jgi:hypothetical protein